MAGVGRQRQRQNDGSGQTEAGRQRWAWLDTVRDVHGEVPYPVAVRVDGFVEGEGPGGSDRRGDAHVRRPAPHHATPGTHVSTLTYHAAPHRTRDGRRVLHRAVELGVRGLGRVRQPRRACPRRPTGTCARVDRCVRACMRACVCATDARLMWLPAPPPRGAVQTDGAPPQRQPADRRTRRTGTNRHEPARTGTNRHEPARIQKKQASRLKTETRTICTT